MLTGLSHPDLAACRKMLDQSLDDKAAAERFYQALKSADEDDPSLLGFKAMSELMLCRHVINPLSKLAHFRKGKNMLEKAISLERQDPELIFFRMTTQRNAPAFLGYGQDLEADKQLLLAYLKNNRAPADRELYDRIKKFMCNDASCSREEQAWLKEL